MIEYFFPALWYLLLSATLLQVTLWLGVFLRLRHARASVAPGSDTRPVSVVICARNEAENLRRNLPLFLQQVYPDFEVVVVNDASDDDTSQVLETMRQKHPQLRYLNIPEKKRSGKKEALALGIAHARHEWLLLSDADCRPASVRWLALMTAPLQQPDAELTLGYGPLDTSRVASRFLQRWAQYETVMTAIQYGSAALCGAPYMGVGRNLAFKRSAYERTGGFERHIDLASGDDDLLVNAAATLKNTRVCFQSDAFVYSDAKPDWKAWFWQKLRHLSASHRYQWPHQLALGTAAASHAGHYFLLAILIFGHFGIVNVLLCYLFRISTVLYVSRRVFPLLRANRLLSHLLILDAFAALYWACFVPFALIFSFKRAISWK